MEAASSGARPVIEIAVSTGLRRGEIFALRWNEIDFSQRQLRLAKSKTDAGERIVPMFDSARKTLLEQKARTRFQRPEDYVFPTSVGTQMNATSWIVGQFYPAMKRAGLEKAFRYDLRHYAVSRLIKQGANILLGASPATRGPQSPSTCTRTCSTKNSPKRPIASIHSVPFAASTWPQGKRRGGHLPSPSCEARF